MARRLRHRPPGPGLDRSGSGCCWQPRCSATSLPAVLARGARTPSPPPPAAAPLAAASPPARRRPAGRPAWPDAPGRVPAVDAPLPRSCPARRAPRRRRPAGAAPSPERPPRPPPAPRRRRSSAPASPSAAGPLRVLDGGWSTSSSDPGVPAGALPVGARAGAALPDRLRPAAPVAAPSCGWPSTPPQHPPGAGAAAGLPARHRPLDRRGRPGGRPLRRPPTACRAGSTGAGACFDLAASRTRTDRTGFALAARPPRPTAAPAPPGPSASCCDPDPESTRDRTPAPPARPAGGRTYAFMAGVVATSLTLAVGLPLVLADRPEQLATRRRPAPTPSPAGRHGHRPDRRDDRPARGGAAAGARRPRRPGAPAAPRSGARGRTGRRTGRPAPSPARPRRTRPPPGRPLPPAPRRRPARGRARRASRPGRHRRHREARRLRHRLRAAPTTSAPASPATARPSSSGSPQAYADEVNGRGGIGGRRLLLAFRTVDILDQQTMRDACTDFAETDRVFAVTQVLGVYGDPILKCARDLRLPYPGQRRRGQQLLRRLARLRLHHPALHPAHPARAWCASCVRLGELKGKKVGFLYEDGYLLPDNDAHRRRARAQRRHARCEGVSSAATSRWRCGRSRRSRRTCAARASTRPLRRELDLRRAVRAEHDPLRLPPRLRGVGLRLHDERRRLPAGHARRVLRPGPVRHGQPAPARAGSGGRSPATTPRCRQVAETPPRHAAGPEQTPTGDYVNAVHRVHPAGAVQGAASKPRAPTPPGRPSCRRCRGLGAFDNGDYGPAPSRRAQPTARTRCGSPAAFLTASAGSRRPTSSRRVRRAQPARGRRLRRGRRHRAC